MNLRQIITGAAIAASALMPSATHAGGSIEAIAATNPAQKDYVRTNVAYELPGDIKGFSFVEWYSDDSHFGRTNLSKELASTEEVSIQAKSSTLHKDDKPDAYSLGVGASTQFGDVKVSGYVLPLWMEQGEITGEVRYGASAGTGFETALGKGYASGFVEFSNDAFLYGEASLGLNLTDKVSVEYNPMLEGNGDMIPGVEHRVQVELRF
jgi:hypothetical protein